jgi:hypothetical protein
MRNFLYAIKSSNVVKCIDTWRETPVEAEDLVVDKGGEREVVEEICEVFPNIGIAIFSKAFVIETIDLGNLAGLVVATNEGDAIRVSETS